MSSIPGDVLALPDFSCQVDAWFDMVQDLPSVFLVKPSRLAVKESSDIVA
jgi:hypothetical protein